MRVSTTYSNLKTMCANMRNPHVALIQHKSTVPAIGISSSAGKYGIPFPRVEHVCNNLAQMPGCTRVEVEMNNVNLGTGSFELAAAAYDAENQVFDRRIIKGNQPEAVPPKDSGNEIGPHTL